MKFNLVLLKSGLVLVSFLTSSGFLLGSCIIVEPVPVRRPIVIKVEDHHDDHHKHKKHEKKKEHKEEEEEDDSIRINGF